MHSESLEVVLLKTPGRSPNVGTAASLLQLGTSVCDKSLNFCETLRQRAPETLLCPKLVQGTRCSSAMEDSWCPCHPEHGCGRRGTSNCLVSLSNLLIYKG